jgi:hypothetical protein
MANSDKLVAAILAAAKVAKSGSHSSERYVEPLCSFAPSRSSRFSSRPARRSTYWQRRHKVGRPAKRMVPALRGSEVRIPSAPPGSRRAGTVSLILKFHDVVGR